MSDEEQSGSEFYFLEVENEGYETVFCQFNEVQYNDNLVYSCMRFELNSKHAYTIPGVSKKYRYLICYTSKTGQVVSVKCALSNSERPNLNFDI